MFADGLRCTHNGTGGASTLVLALTGGYPYPASAFGSSNTINTPYQIAEYSDSTLQTMVRFESGRGSINLATNVLTRASVQQAWTAGGIMKIDNPTALTFGNTAANVVITFGGSTVTQKNSMPAPFNLGSDVWQPFNTRVTYDGSVGTFTMSAGTRLYVPIEYVYGKAITQVAVDVTTGIAGSLRIGVYDTDLTSGGPLNLLSEFTSAAQIDTSAVGFRTVTPGAPFNLPPGFYFLCLQASAAVVLRRLTHNGHGLLSTSGGGARDILMFDKGATYGALPAVADTTVTTFYNRSGGGQVTGLFK